jgi:hypothetical protein
MPLPVAPLVDRSFAAALAHVSAATAPPAFAAKNLRVGLRRPCRGICVAGCVGDVAHCPCAARHAVEWLIDSNSSKSVRFADLCLD